MTSFTKWALTFRHVSVHVRRAGRGEEEENGGDLEERQRARILEGCREAPCCQRWKAFCRERGTVEITSIEKLC